MKFYPDWPTSGVSQAWHGRKVLQEVADELLTPMVKYGGRIFYIGELVKRGPEHWFIPKRWFTRNGIMYAYGTHVEETAVRIHSCHRYMRSLKDTIQDGLIETAMDAAVPVATFTANIQEILSANSGIYPFARMVYLILFCYALLKFCIASCDALCDQMPHPLRGKAGTCPVYSIPIIIFIDDVSGNISKQWNKHWACYLSNGSLPREKLMQEFHVRFVATSPHASPLEIMHGVRESIEFVCFTLVFRFAFLISNQANFF